MESYKSCLNLLSRLRLAIYFHLQTFQLNRLQIMDRLLLFSELLQVFIFLPGKKISNWGKIVRSAFKRISPNGYPPESSPKNRKKKTEKFLPLKKIPGRKIPLAPRKLDPLGNFPSRNFLPGKLPLSGELFVFRHMSKHF